MMTTLNGRKAQGDQSDDRDMQTDRFKNHKYFNMTSKLHLTDVFLSLAQQADAVTAGL